MFSFSLFSAQRDRTWGEKSDWSCDLSPAVGASTVNPIIQAAGLEHNNTQLKERTQSNCIQSAEPEVGSSCAYSHLPMCPDQRLCLPLACGSGPGIPPADHLDCKSQSIPLWERPCHNGRASIHLYCTAWFIVLVIPLNSVSIGFLIDFTVLTPRDRFKHCF